MSLEDQLKQLRITEKPAESGCGCGCSPQLPELVVAPIPGRIRHGAIHGAIGVLTPGEAIVLVAPHDPKPLLAEIAARPEPFEVTYLDNDESSWRIKIERL